VRRYQSYLIRQIAGPFLLIAVGLTAVIWLSQSLNFLDLIVNRGLSLGTFLYLGVLLMPSFLGVILPIALFCAVIFVLNRLAIDSELVSFRAAGLSPWRITLPLLKLAGVVVLVVLAINLYLSPLSYQAFREQQFVIRGDYSAVLLQEGVFTPMGKNLTIYVRSRGSGGELLGILVHDTRAPNRPITMMAEQGALVRTEDGPRFVMFNGNRQEIDREQGRLSLLYFDRYALDMGQLGDSPTSRWRDPRERYLHELLNPSADPDEQRNRGKFLAEAHQRLLSPLYALTLTLIGAAGVLSGEHNRRGHWRRVSAVIVAAFLFEAVALGLISLIAKDSALIGLLYLNLAVGLIVPALFLSGINPLRRLFVRSGPAEAAAGA
jgi:lipopolysaccharide export system permease protein